MIVIAHQNVGKYVQLKPFGAPPQTGKEAFIISLIAKDSTSFIATVDDVVERILPSRHHLLPPKLREGYFYS